MYTVSREDRVQKDIYFGLFIQKSSFNSNSKFAIPLIILETKFSIQYSRPFRIILPLYVLTSKEENGKLHEVIRKLLVTFVLPVKTL